MPAFVVLIIGLLIRASGTLVGQVLLSLGIGYVTYTGIDTALDLTKDQIIGNLSSLPPEVVSLIGFLQVGKCISILFSAMAIRLMLQGMRSGAWTRMIQGEPG